MPQHPFETPAGTVVLGWSADGITSADLPDPSLPPLPPPVGEGCRVPLESARLLGRYFMGEAVDLSLLPVDLGPRSPFFKEVCRIVRAIPRGAVKSYGEVALLAGRPGAARAVGRVMGSNPVAVIIPCHRVVAADGRLTGYSAQGGLTAKARLLAMEGVPLTPSGRVRLTAPR